MGNKRSRLFSNWRWLVSAVLPCAVSVFAISGCGGCRDSRSADRPADDTGAAKAKQAAKGNAKPKADFEAMRVNMVPSDPQDLLRALKPGHWTAAALNACANNFDFKGDLAVHATDRDGHPLPVDGTPYTLAIHRPVVLPKSQKKQLELTLFVTGSLSRPWILSQLRDHVSRIEVKRENEQVLQMPAFQYNLVVLARQPERYRFLRLMEAVRPDTDMMIANEDRFLYRVVAPPLGNRAPLPDQALLWTSTAYLFWDDVPPQIFDPDQEHALLDWLHWGGHLIVSGPASLDALRGSFLAPYLPVASDGSREISATDLAEMASVWTITTGRPGRDDLYAGRPWPGVGWQLQAGGEYLPSTGDLVAERRVGLGCIVVTAFPLSQPELIKWRGFDGFMNACLLRRRPRVFQPGEGGVRRTEWLGTNSFFWNPREVTHLRYFARDSGTPGKRPASAPASDDEFYGEESQGGGAAAWNDFGSVPTAVRKSLREGAGIVIPRPSFVLWILGLYLVVLVPLNWSIFRMLGRVEWAWAATPVVSLTFAAVVIWLAQLDIGFARSSTELAIVELQGGYSRAHLSRYTALYASLSTGYDLHYEAPSTVAQPFPAVADFALLRGQTRHEVVFGRDEGTTLSGLEVSSNSTSMVHSESMWDLGGALSWHESADRPPEVVNATPLNLTGVGLVRQRTDGNGQSRVESAWIGDLAPGATVQPAFAAIDDESKYQRLLLTPESAEGLNLAELVQIAEDSADLEPGEIRLIGWCLDDLPGLDIQPAGPRRRHATMVVAHLARQHARPPQLDVWRIAEDVQPPKAVTEDDPFGEVPRPGEAAPMP